MNDMRDTSLAITEKKPHKPGGCVGIFFQLFDWNRRFAKKKLFSKKLLPPARPSQVPRKFGSDDKLPKHRLIANENSGGFPNAKKNGNFAIERKSETKTPGLVARLMGLESMPAVGQDESTKDSFFDSDEEGFKSGFNYDRFDKEDVDKDMVSGKHEVRPQKLQKTGTLERQPLTRFGSEALQFRNVLSRSRKHHPKLASPVKSPRMSTGRNSSSRLFDAAARILEPGLQATSRAKCTIAYKRTLHCSPNPEVMMQETKAQTLDFSENCNYSRTVHHSFNNEAMMKETMAHSLNFPENCNYHPSTTNPLSGQSCRNCGSSLEEDPVPFAAAASNYVNPCFQESERSDPRPASYSFEIEKAKIVDRCKEKSTPYAEARNGVRPQSEAYADRNPFAREGLQRHSASHQFRSQKNSQSPSLVKNRIRQNQVLRGRDRAAPKSSSCNFQNNRTPSAMRAISERANVVTKNENVTSRARSRLPVKVETNGKCESERRPCNKQDSSLSPVRKKRPGNINHQGESSAFVSSDFAAQRNGRRDVTTGKGLGPGIQSMNRSSKRNLLSRAGVNNKVVTPKDNDIVTFTFNSPLKHKIEGDVTYGSTRDSSLSGGGNKNKNSIPDHSSVVTGDALGALLEQKLKELTSQCEDDLTAENTPPRRTTAVILQELISALNAENPESHNHTILRPNQEKVSCKGDESSNRKLTFQDKKRSSGASAVSSQDPDRLSPGSILEAPFSNDSCLSSSVDGSSGPNQYPDSIDCSYNDSQTLYPDTELWDSATSLENQTSGLQLVIDLSHISGVFFSLGFPENAMYEIKLAHAKEVILNAEFIFRNLPHTVTFEPKHFSLSRFLTGELEALGSAMSANDVELLNVMDMKGGTQRFLFDCVIEYLETIYVPYSNVGPVAWRRLPSCMTNNKLISGVVYEVRRWMRFNGMSPDEIIERDMSHSVGKWTDFEVEAYELGSELSDELLEILVDEVVSYFDELDCCYGM